MRKKSEYHGYYRETILDLGRLSSDSILSTLGEPCMQSTWATCIGKCTRWVSEDTWDVFHGEGAIKHERNIYNSTGMVPCWLATRSVAATA